MAGYSGFSMSNNAVDAYDNGEKPFRKMQWRIFYMVIIPCLHIV